MTMKVLDPAAFQIRKETILGHARHLFANKGYAETSVDDIAQACNIRLRTYLNHTSLTCIKQVAKR